MAKFKPGESGNPAGRRKGAKSFTTKVRAALEVVSGGNGDIVEQELIKAILRNAINKGDVVAQKMIWNYLDGMPRQAIHHSGAIENSDLTPEQKQKLDFLLNPQENDKQTSTTQGDKRDTGGTPILTE